MQFTFQKQDDTPIFKVTSISYPTYKPAANALNLKRKTKCTGSKYKSISNLPSA